MTVGELKKKLTAFDDSLPVSIGTSSFGDGNKFSFASDITFADFVKTTRVDELDREDIKESFLLLCDF